MNENNDITQRAFWNLPAPGGIIATHWIDDKDPLKRHGKIHISNIYPDWPFINDYQKQFFFYGGVQSGKKFARRMQEQFGNRESPDSFYKRVSLMTGEPVEEIKKRYGYTSVNYRPICEGITGKGCLRGQNAAGEICDLCKGTGLKIENDENKTS